MMYSKTLIILVVLLCIALLYLALGCNCETQVERFQSKKNSNNEVVDNINEQLANEINEQLADEINEQLAKNTNNKQVESSNKPTTTSIITTQSNNNKNNTKNKNNNKNNTKNNSKNESQGVKPIILDLKYSVNSFNVDITNIPEIDNIQFTDLRDEFARVDISGIESNVITFSTLIKAVIPPDSDEKTIENQKQVIASSSNWYIELKSRKVKLVYNGVPVESGILIKFDTVYLITVVISNTYTSIMINGNETKKEYNVPNFSTESIKLGLSSSNNTPFYGYMANWDVVEGDLKPTEVCNRHNFCSAEAPPCNFKPAGKTRMDCIKLCDLNENCSSVECQNACLNCNNPINCEWLSLEKKTDSQELVERSVPDAPEIRAIPHGDGQIVLDWQAPESYGSPIKNYAIVVNESFNKNNGLTFRQLTDTTCTSCEYVINGLRNRVYYDVTVAAINDLGVGEFSNIESVAPQGPVKNSDISSLLIEDDGEIEESARKTISDNLDSQICHSILSQSRDGHFLNKKKVRFADQIKEELIPKLIE